MPKALDLLWMKFGRLTVVRECERVAGARRRVECRCACGSVVTVEPRDLNSGRTRSCGCYQKDAVAAANVAQRTTHGLSKSSEYESWQKMKARCLNPSDPKYPAYGGRGIAVCARWEVSFGDFFADMGPKPSPSHTIDRIDVDGHYTPENCRWASPSQQSNNKRKHRFVEWDGRKVPLSVACRETGVNYRSALWRVNQGKPWNPLPPAPSQPSVDTPESLK